jgi:hypothetical protein
MFDFADALGGMLMSAIKAAQPHLNGPILTS